MLVGRFNLIYFDDNIKFFILNIIIIIIKLDIKINCD